MDAAADPRDVETPGEDADAEISVSSHLDQTRVLLWALPRTEAERIYADAFQKNDIETVRWLAANDRYFLLTCILRRPDARYDWIYARCREVEANADSHIDLWARGHYKSTIITFAGVIQEIIRNPEITIGIYSHARPAAKAFLTQVKVELEDNQFLKDLFPDTFWQDPGKQAKRWSDEALVVKRKSNPKEATVEAWGLYEGLPTGKHFILRVYDDVVTERTVTTPDMIKKITERFDLSEYTGTRDGRVWIVGTRYHFGDTYGILISRGTYKERRHPATHDGSFDGRPVFLTDAQWEKELRQPKPAVAAQMLLNPTAGAETTFAIEHLRFWDVRPKTVNIYILVDPSLGTARDLTAIAVVAIDAQRNKYLVDGYAHRMTLSKRWVAVRNLYRKWSRLPGVMLCIVGYERYGMQTDLQYIDERMEIEKISVPIEELNSPKVGAGNKAARINRLEPDFRMSNFYLPHVIEVDDEGHATGFDPMGTKLAQRCIDNGEKWRVARPIVQIDEDGKTYSLLLKFLEEYIFYPMAPHDDFLDALSRIYDVDSSPAIAYAEGDAEGRTSPPVFEDGI